MKHIFLGFVVIIIIAQAIVQYQVGGIWRAIFIGILPMVFGAVIGWIIGAVIHGDEKWKERISLIRTFLVGIVQRVRKSK